MDLCLARIAWRKKCLGMLRKRENDEGHTKPISAVGASQKWTRLPIAIDSGACDSAIDPENVPGVQLMDTKESLSGEEFQSATGEPIPNLGELKVSLLTRGHTLRGMAFTGAPVAKPLASARKICTARHTVIFDECGSYIHNKSTGEVNQLRGEQGNYMLDMYVPPNNEVQNDVPGVHRHLP